MPRIVLIAAAVFWSTAALAQVPPGYPADYAAVIEAAKKEGKVVVYSTTDAAAANPLLKDFAGALSGRQGRLYRPEFDRALQPLHRRGRRRLRHRRRAVVVGHGSAGQARRRRQCRDLRIARRSHRCPNGRSGRIRPTARPTSRSPSSTTSAWCRRPTCRRTIAALLKLLNTKPDAYKGKITAYDPEKSGVGYLFVNEDVKNFPQAWDLFRAFGKTGIKLYTSAGAMIERVTSGEHTIAYGIFGSYALARSKKVPNLGVITPKDYTLVTSRVAFISSQGEEPERRQAVPRLSACRSAGRPSSPTRPTSIRCATTSTGEATVKGVSALIGDKARPVPISDELLANLDRGQAACVPQAVAGRDEGTVRFEGSSPGLTRRSISCRENDGSAGRARAVT